MPPDTSIRLARTADLPAILEILNQAITEETIAIIDPVNLAERQQWFVQHTPATFPILVAEVQGKISGWCSLSAYRSGRRALGLVTEISYFVHRDQRRRGIATLLVERMLALAPGLGYETVVALLLDDNPGSIRLLERFGFVRWGLLPGIVDFNGRRVGHLYYGRKL
ncbi:MAG: N-acetyltransferase [Candidatus Delongbacteria bacterium]|nr:N-acetyltransferase [Candidatus Delongbacteria bacterium]